MSGRHTQKPPTTLAELVEVLVSLPERPPLERARIARALGPYARAIISEVGDRALFEAVHEVVGVKRRSYVEAAKALGVTPAAVNVALARYRSRHK